MKPAHAPRLRPQRWAALAVAAAVLLSGAQAAAAQIVRGPYLQSGTTTSVTLRWRTDEPVASQVRLGTDPQTLDLTRGQSDPTTDHTVVVDGLSADTEYFYAIGDGTQTLVAGADYRFRTNPQPGSEGPTRIWVLGDSGTADANAEAVRDAFHAWAGDAEADLWLMLGDNAYSSGTDGEYQRAVFDLYPTMLRRAVLWSTIGNHDDRNRDVYLDIFTLPTGGEAGGVASGTEAYYSFDYANIHFVCLDSEADDLSDQGPMAQWLRQDLMANTQRWLVVFFHHPPYSKGSHDSDTEGRLVDMRERFVPILEDYGVDLVLTGHSHSYERSYLLDGHYGDSQSFDRATMAVDPGDGRPDGDGAYRKEARPHDGAVYAVAGSSGKKSGGSLDHPAMFVSLNQLGSMVLDVRANRLEAAFVNAQGEATDTFTIVKGADTYPPEVVEVRATAADTVRVQFDEPMDSSTTDRLANWTISQGVEVLAAQLGDGGRAVTLTTSPMPVSRWLELSIAGVADAAGNALSPTTRRFAWRDIQEVTFQDGVAPTAAYAGTRDVSLKSDEPTVNFGQAAELEADGSPDYGVLLRWDVSTIPAGVVIDSATITLEVTNSSADAYGLHPMRRGWSESEATWEQAQAGAPWTGAGAIDAQDRKDTVVAVADGWLHGRHALALGADGAATVQAWVDDPAENFGLVMQNYDSASNGLDFHSREAADAATRPALTVRYHAPVTEPPATGEDAGHASSDGGVGSSDSGSSDGGSSDTSGGDRAADSGAGLSAGAGAGGAEGGCGCQTGWAGQAAPALLLAMGWLLALRRRRK